MTISIPDTLNTDNSGKYILSIRLRSDGLSFSGYIPSLPGSLFYRDVVCEKGSLQTDFLKEVFFANEFLTWTYREIHIVTETPLYTLVPKMLYDPKRKQEFLDFTFSQPLDHTLSAEWNEIVFLYNLDREIYEFCTRSFINPVFHPHILPTVVFCAETFGVSLQNRVCVVLYSNRIDLLCFHRGDLQLVNSFQVTGIEDILYYILYVWKQQEFDQEKDTLSLFGAAGRYNGLSDMLRTYIRNVEPLEIPSEVYLLGGEVVTLPMDLIALSVCEL